jgi:general secretion pathway protein I
MSMLILFSMRKIAPPVSDKHPANRLPINAEAPLIAAAGPHGPVGTESRRRPRQIAFVPGGFTLLEVMIAMAILAVALVAVYQSQSQSISMTGSSRFLTTASLLAQSRMVEIDAEDNRKLASGKGDFGDDFPDYIWQVKIYATPIRYLKKIVLTVINTRMTIRNTYNLTLYKVELP